ncbi:MAG: metal-binding protein [Betaproteobacteria bacterium HGW-Betaproteobacteria-4]|nr:MAG: metal-binding protein [Betaproteobacteria bacterium HGW-Betaproteobacteria-4]
MSKPVAVFLTVFALATSIALPAAAADAVDVYKSPYCGCCGKWIDHLKAAGFAVRTHEVNDVPAARQRLGMPEQLGSCHTAKVGGYLVEGHVPAADIERLLKEKPAALGLAVPAMPPGSPGMESPRPVPYQTLLVQPDGKTSVYARH